MRIGTIRWNGEEAKITFSDNFHNAHYVLKYDALQDIIYEAKKMYEQLEKERKNVSNSR